MYCQNCGAPIPQNVSSCPSCGSIISPNSSYQKQSSSISVKWYQKTPAIILLLIFFFPIGLFLMWKYCNWNKKIKIIISIVIALLAICVVFSDTDSTEPSETSTTSVATTTEKATTMSKLDKNIEAFTSISNLTADEAEAILEDLKNVGCSEIDNVSVFGSQSNADSGASFNVSSNGYSVNIIVIERKTDYISSGDIVLFKNGKAVDNIQNYILTDDKKGSFIYYAKEYVLQGLKSPSTAEFPGTILEIGEWKISRNNNIVTVQSYVDSQNSFGAMLRSDFAVQMDYSDNSLLYMEIGGTVVYGSPQ